jgi:elongation factor P
MADTSILKKGLCIIFKDEPHLVMEKTFVSPGKGTAFFRTKLKNLKTKGALDFTFKSGEKIEEANLQTQEVQFLYKQGESLFFMNPRTYEQITIPQEMLGNFQNFIKEGDSYQVYTLEGEPVSLRAPQKVKLKVIKAEDAVRGNTVAGATKPATVETGYQLQVPLFVKEGDYIIINTETGEYVERA